MRFCVFSVVHESDGRQFVEKKIFSRIKTHADKAGTSWTRSASLYCFFAR